LLSAGVDLQDHDGDGDREERIPLGAFITGSELIGPATDYFCGDGICQQTESCIACPGDCSCPVTCIHAADLAPCDGEISMQELSLIIAAWRQGTSITLSSLIEVIRLWKG
jgi:hypothetical protein